MGSLTRNQHAYDGVLAGAAKAGSGSRMEDYTEIFGGSRSCSIPILDLPELKDGKAEPLAARNSRLDYSKIFGQPDFAVPYQDLVAKPKKLKNSSQVTGTAAEARFCPAGPEHSSFLGEKQAPSSEASFQSLDGMKQFNLSYSKSNPGSKDGTSGMTHVAQLHAIPGYNCLIDEITHSQTNKGDKAVRAVLNDPHLNVSVGEEMKQSKQFRKAVSGPQPRVAAKNTSKNYADFKTKSSRNRSFSNDISFDAFDIGLGTPPSTVSPPSSLPNFGNNVDGSIRSMNSKFGVSKSDVAKGAAGSYSPPLFYEDIDANSAAAASAAAVRKAIEEAQAKIKIAKDLMERKKAGLQNHVKPTFNGLKADRREVKGLEKVNRSIKEDAQEMHQKVYTSKQVFSCCSSEENAVEASQLTPDFINSEKSFPMKNAVGESHNREPKWTQVDHGLGAESDRATNGFSEAAGASEQKQTLSEVKQANIVENVNLYANEKEYKDRMRGVENVKKPMECEKKLKAFEEASKQEVLETKLNAVEVALKWDIFRNIFKLPEKIHCQKDAEEKVSSVYERKEADQTPEAPCEQGECESIVKRFHEPKENMNFEIHESEENKNMKELKEAQDWAKFEKALKEAQIQEEIEDQSNEIIVGQENERRVDEIHEHGVNRKGKREDLERLECEEKQPQSWDLEENEKKQNDVLKPEGDENSGQVHEKEATESIIGVNKLHKNENACETDEAHGDQEEFEDVEVTAEIFAVEDNLRMMEVTEDLFPNVSGKGSETLEEANELLERDNFETCVPEQGLVGLNGIKKQTAELYSGEIDLNFDHKQDKHHVTEYERVCELEKYSEEETSQLDENDKDVGDPEIGPCDEDNESFGSSRGESWLGNGIESKTQCELERHAEQAACEFGENNKDVKVSEGRSNYEENETYFESSSEGKWVNNKNDVKAGQQLHMFEGEGENMGICQEERTNQATDEEEENHHETLTVENKEAEDVLQKEVELEKQHHGRKEEAKLREIEKEKERIAVERAIREARERAFAEARERAAAERATVEAQQKVMAGARERLEKAYAEANGKEAAAAEKASIEAKLKAERAAVERATAEARERALEKALSEKAAFKAKIQAEKLAAEKFSSASRDPGMKSNDQQYKGPGPLSSSRHPSSSNYDDLYSTESFSGANGESLERCKATFERNQRTAERAAKALAEKNMRELLAQKEQAERNRLAETLDADVKRWSSGKERNLRALLSTLQYILGPDSGWQPIPLTDIISAAAVKKAYRKATLFVHPDKLQQRGASIQQKYMCEKVFDLLKDAWNKFTAEER